jgi:2-amino-4-hydroxy-6-hydroxymethyldihydropteridine diphosphokinase
VSSRAYVGLGANLGANLSATLTQAALRLAALPGTQVAALSSVWRSAPVDAGGPDFLNAVVALDTTLQPVELLDALQVIELAHGRERPYRNAPRTLDLDLLLYDELRLDTPRLTLRTWPRMSAGRSNASSNSGRCPSDLEIRRCSRPSPAGRPWVCCCCPTSS